MGNFFLDQCARPHLTVALDLADTGGLVCGVSHGAKSAPTIRHLTQKHSDSALNLELDGKGNTYGTIQIGHPR
jgi:hypothetical protein